MAQQLISGIHSVIGSLAVAREEESKVVLCWMCNKCSVVLGWVGDGRAHGYREGGFFYAF